LRGEIFQRHCRLPSQRSPLFFSHFLDVGYLFISYSIELTLFGDGSIVGEGSLVFYRVFSFPGLPS